MAEMEDKFQEILGNDQAMSQIMSIAQSISGGSGEGGSGASTSMNSMNMEEMLGGIDQKWMARGMRLMGAYQTEHRTVGLMTALRPFVKEERYEMMERLTQATKLAKVASCLIEMWGEEGDDV